MKKKILLGITSVLLLMGCSSTTIKEEDFKTGLNNFTTSSANDAGYEVSLNDDKMVVNYFDEEYTLTYNLKNDPTIIYEAEVEKGISYDEYNSKLNGISLPMLGYIAIADTYDVASEDAYVYFADNFINEMFTKMSENTNNYIITDTNEGYEETDNIILTSEFGDKVIEYTQNMYGDSLLIEDKETDTYTYELTTKCNQESCTVTAKLTVNPKGDFAKINGYADEMAKENMDQSITPDTADYNIELVVGQKANITGANGYEMSGMDVVSILDEENAYVFEAVKAGVANGSFYIDDEARTFYITVTEKGSNNTEDINIKIK